MSDPFLAVGRISRAHGVHGEVSVLNLTEVESRFESGSVLRLDDGRRLTVERTRPHGHRLLVKFREVADRTQADALRGQVLLVSREDVPAAPHGAFWVHQVVGLDVVTEGGRPLGQVAEVLHNPANDIWVARSADGEVLVPALRDLVVDVDLAARRVVVREVEGLTAPESRDR